MTPHHSSKSQLIALLSLGCVADPSKEKVIAAGFEVDLSTVTRSIGIHCSKSCRNIYEQFVNTILDHIWPMSNEVSAKHIDNSC